MQVLVLLKVCVREPSLVCRTPTRPTRLPTDHFCQYLQGCPDLNWQRQCPVGATCGSVLKAFCKHYSLSSDTCSLCLRGTPVDTDRTLRQV